MKTTLIFPFVTWFVLLPAFQRSAPAVEYGAVSDQQEAASGQDLLTILLKQLATSAERSMMGGRMGYAGHNPPDVVKLCRAVRLLSVLPAAQRYAVLKAWMLPAQPGALPRSAMCYAPLDWPPEVFFDQGERPSQAADTDIGPRTPRAGPGSDGVICFSELLVAAAAECGKLEELAAEVNSFAKNPEMADTLSDLAKIALDGDTFLAERGDAIMAPWRPENRTTARDSPPSWPAHMIARVWMANEASREQGKQLAELLARFAVGAGKRSLLSCIRRDMASCRARDCDVPLLPGAPPELALWHPGGYYFSSGRQVGTWPPWWVEYGGMIVHLSGPEVSPLYFDYPLTGDFEFSVDGYFDDAAESAVQYGRFIFEPRWRRGKACLLGIGERQILEHPDYEARRGGFHQLVIRVNPTSVRYLCDGNVVYEDRQPGSTTPWLALPARSTRTTAWCNLRMIGTPRIPREVRLIQDDRMGGWMSALYRERLPRQRQLALDAGRTAPAPASAARQYAWYAADGVLHGPRLKSSNRTLTIQSWLAYHRPLREGESLSYEFFYQPGEKMVHPTLGRIAIMLDPEGVRLHWITDVPHMSIGGLAVDNAVVIAEARRGSKTLRLLPDQWNQVTITMARDGAAVRLNGADVYVHRLTPTDSRMFGFFRYRTQTSAEVRRIVLTGDWPQRLTDEQMAVPAARTRNAKSDASTHCRAALAEDFFRTRPQGK